MIETQTIEAMTTAGDEQVANLERKISELKAQIDAHHLEQEALANDYQARKERLQQVSARVAGLEESHGRLVGYAVLAQDKPNHPSAIKNVADARRSLDAAKKELAQLTREHEEANQAASAQEAEIKQQLALFQSESQTRFDELQRLAAGRDRAIRELGERKYAALSEEYDQRCAAIDQQARALVAAQADLHACYEGALQTLTQWPDQRRAMVHKRPAENDTSRAMEAAMYYADAILAYGPGLQDLPRPLSLYDALIVPDDIVMLIKRQPQSMQMIRDRIKQTLDAYRAHLANTR